MVEARYLPRWLHLLAALALTLPVGAAEDASPCPPKSACAKAFERGLALEEREGWTAARDAFARAVELGPEFAEGWLHLALCQERLGQRDEAAKAAEQALLVAPDSGTAAELLSRLRLAEALELVSQDKDAEAKPVFEAALAAHEANAEAHFQLGLCLLRLDDTLEARRHLARFQKLAPAHASVPIARTLLAGLERD